MQSELYEASINKDHNLTSYSLERPLDDICHSKIMYV